MRAKIQPQQQNPALLLRTQILLSNVGQVAHVSPTSPITSQNVDIAGRIPEAACWLRLGCWSNSAANSHSCPGPFNSRVLRSCLVPQRSYPPHWPLPSVKPCELRLDACVLTSRQLPYSRRHRTCWASSQRSHTLSSTSFHGAWTPALLSAHLSTGCECTASQIETPICTRRTTTHQFTWQQQKCDALGGSPMEGGMIE